MNSKKAKRAARLRRKNKAQHDDSSASRAALDAERERMIRLTKEAELSGEPLRLGRMPVKVRKGLKKPLISEAERKSIELGKRIMAEAQGRENEAKKPNLKRCQ